MDAYTTVDEYIESILKHIDQGIGFIKLGSKTSTWISPNHIGKVVFLDNARISIYVEIFNSRITGQGLQPYKVLVDTTSALEKVFPNIEHASLSTNSFTVRFPL